MIPCELPDGMQSQELQELTSKVNNDFDLNDIQHEPTDAQFQTLMNAVASEANRRAELAKEALMQRLRDDIVAAKA